MEFRVAILFLVPVWAMAGVSCITNLAAGLSPHKLSHQEVIDISRAGSEKLCRLLEAAIPRLVQRPEGHSG